MGDQTNPAACPPDVGDFVAGMERHRHSMLAGGRYGLVKSRLQIGAHKGPWVVTAGTMTGRRPERLWRESGIPDLESVEVSVDPRLKIAWTIGIHAHVGSAHVGNVKRHQVSMVVGKPRPKLVSFLEKGQIDDAWIQLARPNPDSGFLDKLAQHRRCREPPAHDGECKRCLQEFPD
jgi:hypothetical protein